MQAFRNALGLNSHSSGKGAAGADSSEAIVEINVVDQSLELLDGPVQPAAEEEEEEEKKAKSEENLSAKEEAVTEEPKVVVEKIPEVREQNGDLEISLEDFESRQEQSP